MNNEVKSLISGFGAAALSAAVIFGGYALVERIEERRLVKQYKKVRAKAVAAEKRKVK